MEHEAGSRAKKASGSSYAKIILGISALLLVMFAVFLLIQSGIFQKAPKVEAVPENRFDRTLTVITDEDYRPYSFFDQNGTPSGHDVELIYLIANELQMNVDLRLMNWYDGIAAISAGEADVLMTCDYSDTFAGVDQLLKCEPVSFDEFLVYSKTPIDSPDELYGKRIGIMQSGNVTATIEMMNLGQYCARYPDNRQAMQALIDGEVDYAVMRQTVGTILLQELDATGIEGYISIGQSYMCFGIRVDRPEIADKINLAIESLKMQGELNRLRNKWLTTFIRPYSFAEVLQNNVSSVVLFGILAVILVASMIINSHRIRKNEAEQLRNAQVVEQLAHDFECVNYVELTGDEETDTVVNYRISERLKALIPGWDRETSFKRKMELLRDNVVFEHDRQQFGEDVKRARIIEELKASDVYFVNTRALIDGEVRFYQLKISPTLENGRIKGIVAGLHSVDEQTKKELELQKQLENALAMAQSASRAKTTFLSNMSHDIRTPMNAIIGFTDLAEKHVDDRGRILDYLGKIKQSSRHLLSLINDVLDMSRIESGKMKLENKEENIPELVEAIRDMVQASMQEKRHTFSVEMENITDEDVICDRLRLNQILLNILSNSIKYTPDGGNISMRVTETGKTPEGGAEYQFRIADNGIGMEQAYLETIYEPFTRVNSSTVSGIQGTGLGMAITKNIVDMMGGTIEIESEPGKGTEMTVTLTFRPTGHSGKNRDSSKELSSSAQFTGMKVLLVEDNALNREIATEILTEEGILVTVAEDGEDAVDLMKDAQPGDFDLILMDVQMPRMDGYTATRQIRSLGTEIASIPIIAMTANAFEEDRKTAMDNGMNEHIAKPIDIRKLNATLSRFLKEDSGQGC